MDVDGRAFLVVELMKGSLKGLLTNPEKPLTWATRLTFAEDIAGGMSYLHENGTVHRGEFYFAISSMISPSCHSCHVLEVALASHR